MTVTHAGIQAALRHAVMMVRDAYHIKILMDCMNKHHSQQCTMIHQLYQNIEMTC